MTPLFLRFAEDFRLPMSCGSSIMRFPCKYDGIGCIELERRQLGAHSEETRFIRTARTVPGEDFSGSERTGCTISAAAFRKFVMRQEGFADELSNNHAGKDRSCDRCRKE
jgi:hypothetical protein